MNTQNHILIYKHAADLGSDAACIELAAKVAAKETEVMRLAHNYMHL